LLAASWPHTSTALGAEDCSFTGLDQPDAGVAAGAGVAHADWTGGESAGGA
jgi:hypothetical protein